MKRQLFLFAFLLFSLLVGGAGKDMYYIVDGIPGVPFDQLPPAEEIASQRELDPEEAAYIYGDRAANGAVIINTKEYARKKEVQAVQYKREYEQSQAREEQKRIQQEAIAKQNAIQRQKDQKMSILIFGIESVLVAFIIFLLFRKSKTCLEEAGRIARIENSQHATKGESFNITNSSGFHAITFILLILVISFTLFLWWFCTSVRISIMNGIIMVSIEGLLLYILIEFIFHLRQCCIVVDEEGIRGVCTEYLFAVIPQYKGINIRWEEVVSAKVIDVPLGNRTEDCLVFYSDENCQNEVDSVLLLFFPTREITAQINRFYARYSGHRLIK